MSPTHKKLPTCTWCGREIPAPDGPSRGRPKKFCSHSCRQRAYEQRKGVQGTALPEDAVVFGGDRMASFQDSLFELRCSAEDIATAVEEGAPAQEVRQLCEELVDLARRVEKLR